MPKIFNSLSEKNLASVLKNGAVGIIPTDTLYGLVASANDPKSAERVLMIKGRKYKPGTLIAANTRQLVDLGVKSRYLKAVEQFWPGAVSVVLPVPPELDYLHTGEKSLPIRIPNDDELLKLLIQTGPLITTSANKPKKKPANNITEAQSVFGNTIDFYVDGGDLSDRKPSTIIRIIDDEVEVLREGAVKM